MSRHIVIMLTCALLACGDRGDGARTASGAATMNQRSVAADVPDIDVRRLPPERKAILPDVLVRTADRARVLGADSAPVQLFIVSDLQCAACKRWHEERWPSVRRDYVERGTLRVTFVHFPLRTNQHAVLAASAAMCAAAQGQFWSAIDRLFTQQSRWATMTAPETVLDSLASVPGVDARTLRECTASHRMWRQIRADINWSEKDGVSELPMIVIGTHRMSARASLAQLRVVIDSALAGK